MIFSNGYAYHTDEVGVEEEDVLAGGTVRSIRGTVSNTVAV